MTLHYCNLPINPNWSVEESDPQLFFFRISPMDYDWLWYIPNIKCWSVKLPIINRQPGEFIFTCPMNRWIPRGWLVMNHVICRSGFYSKWCIPWWFMVIQWDLMVYFSLIWTIVRHEKNNPVGVYWSILELCLLTWLPMGYQVVVVFWPCLDWIVPWSMSDTMIEPILGKSG